MEGIFIRKKFSFRLFILFFCGLFLIGSYFFINSVDSETSNGIIIFLIVGFISILTAVISWLFNRGAFIKVDETSFKAKYHWFGKIDCKMSDVIFVSPRFNTLVVELKDGKAYSIMGVKNSQKLASFIRTVIPFEIHERSELLIQKLNDLVSIKKKRIVRVCIGVAFMIVNIFATVFLTSAKEMHEFTKFDWVIFATMGVIEIAIIIITFYLAKKTGKYNIQIEKLRYTIPRQLIETEPLLPGNAIKVYTDENYTGRITLFGYPGETSVYYTAQMVTPDYAFNKPYQSQVYESSDVLQTELDELIDITKNFLH